MDMSDQQKEENELMKLKISLRNEMSKRERLEEDLQKMTARVIEVQEEEWRRISRNLHDGIGQNLYSHLITINLLQSQTCHPLIDQIEGEAVQLIEEIREISWELRPAVLDDLGLVPAIRSYMGRFSDFHKIKVEFDCNLQKRIPINIELTIYRIIQESLTNIRKYAQTEQAHVSIQERNQWVMVKIEDFGIGFDYRKAVRGVGLFSMEERARAVGGTLSIHSAPGKGTSISLEVPL